MAQPSHCLNCAQPVEHHFCGHCGQENHDYRESLWPLVGDLVEELFQLESRIWRSLRALLFSPGLLTVEYNAGRRVRYTSPLRLYLLLGAIFFTLSALRPAAQLVPIEVHVGHEAKAPSKPVPRWLEPLIQKSAELEKVGGAETAKRLRPSLEGNMPRAFAVLVPIFALLLKLFYRRRFYVEHLVFALHVNAFSFAAMLPWEWRHSTPLYVICSLATFVYLALAMRRVFAESWKRTLVKLTAIMLAYFFFAALVMIPLYLVALLNS
jgi:hypothetical protein